MSLINFRQITTIILFVFIGFFGASAQAAQISGNNHGNIVVEEFFDYQCPHCRIMLENTDRLARTNQNVKLITRVVPLMDRSSWIIARAVLAARQQGKYSQLHHLLMQQRQNISFEQLLSLAEMAGINVSQLKRDMQSKSIVAELNANISASRNRGVDIIPATFVYREGKKSSQIRIVGDKSLDELQQTISSL